MKMFAPFRHSRPRLMESPGRLELVAAGTKPADEDRELALVRRCRAADGSAWRSLYEAHHPFVHRVARRLGTPSDEVEDVVHEVFMVVIAKLDQFQGGRFTTWLYRITANVTSHYHRKRRRRRMLQTWFVPFGQTTPPSPEAHASAASDARTVDAILECMTPKKREVFALFELEGLSGEEIAERVGCPVNTVWSRLRHARRDFLRIGRRQGVLEGSE